MKKIILFIFTFLSITVCISQEKSKKKDKKKSKVSFSGSVGINYEMYNFSQENYPTFRPRYPDNLFRLNAQATLSIGKHFSIPMSVTFSNQKVVYSLPSLPEESMLDYIQNPANNISISPKYKWFQAHLGTHTALYSPLSTGDIPMFGAGIDINPGKFIFSANYGISQRAVEPDASLNIPGAYRQDIIATRIGFGKIEGSRFTINVVKIKDDINSVNSIPLNTKPIEGILVSPFIKFKISEQIELSTETAGSVYTSDLLNKGIIDEKIIQDVANIITINASSKADIAHNSRIDWKGKKMSLGGEINYIGARFLPVGYRFAEKDILDYKINTGLKLFKEKINLSGSFGIRTNNLTNNKLSQSKRVIANATIFAQMSEALSINASYSNFGFSNDASLLNQRVELVNNSITLSPSYSFKTTKINHLIGANLGLNNFEQFNVSTNAFETTKNNTYGLNYNLFFLKIPLNLNFRGLYLNNQMVAGSFSMLNYGLTVSYKLFNKKITPSLALNFANINKEGYTTDNRANIRFKIRYKITKKLNFKAEYRFTNYTYGSSKPNALVDQNRIQFALQQKF